MIERFLKQTQFTSTEDFNEHLEFIIPEHFNFAYDVMDAWAEEAPDKLALLWTNDEGVERRATFGQLKQESDQAAAYLQSLGIGKGDPVMLILKRRYEWWITMLALHKLAAVVIPATHMLTKHDIIYRNTRASVKAIICVDDPYVTGQIREALPESPTLKLVVEIGEGGDQTGHSEDGFLWLTSKEIPSCLGGSAPMPSNLSPLPREGKRAGFHSNDDTMLMYFTSGTSGEPKMVAHDFLYAMGHLTTGVFWHNLSEDSLHLTVADTGWGKAVWGKFYGQWFAGATVFVYDHEQFNADRLLRQMEKYRVTSFCAPPTIYRFMIREDLTQYDLSALRYCCTAGEALNPAVYQKFYEQTGIRLMEGFGQTETTMTLGTFPWMEPKPGSMGKPNGQYQIDLLKPDGTPCEDGEKGEIVIRAPYNPPVGDKQSGDVTPPAGGPRGAVTRPLGLFKEYYRDPELTRQAWHDGIYHTGDVAWRDEDGYYWFEGRTDDVIKSSGYRIGPFEVESALMTHPAVVECAITGVPDDIRGMVVKATVVLGKEWKEKAGDELIKELQQHVKRETAPYKYPRIIEFVDELPKTISGKIRRVEIRNKDNKK
ncbi:MAG: AMP-binding protein [Bacteroidaceae bacterium]|nr:AMP-binding protein [Bacteroidaceae bacterium]